MAPKKTTSAGVIITDGTSLLLCHVTGSKHWDLPKGKVDPGETEIAAAVRELREETGIVVAAELLSPLGTFFYKKNKDLSLWLLKQPVMPDVSTLDCVSTFTIKDGTERKEMDGFRNVLWTDISNHVVPDMLRVLIEIQKLL